MFTGIIEEIGIIKQIDKISGGMRLFIECSKILDDVKVDDSISVNGVCLTVTKMTTNGFWLDAVGETLNKTTLKNVNPFEKVNLERALRLSDRLGGHLVQGHVNGLGKISQIKKLGENYYLEIELPAQLIKYTISEGSIAIDGISLTIAKLQQNKLGISVIPHTWDNTNLRFKKINELVNIETDFLAKYIENFVRLKNEEPGENKFTDQWFKKMGY